MTAARPLNIAECKLQWRTYFNFSITAIARKKTCAYFASQSEHDRKRICYLDIQQSQKLMPNIILDFQKQGVYGGCRIEKFETVNQLKRLTNWI